MVSLIQDYALLSNGLLKRICVAIRVRPKKLSSTTMYASLSLLKGVRGATGPPGLRRGMMGRQVITFLRSYNKKHIASSSCRIII